MPSLPDIDSIRPMSLREPYTLGTAIALVEDLVAAAIEWSRMPETHLVNEREALLNQWFAASQVALGEIFTSSAPLLGFACSQPDIRVSPHRAQLDMIHRHLSRGLLRVRDDLLAERERVAVSVAELAMRVAQHDELVTLIRDARGMTEEVWLRVVGDPMVAPPTTRLLSLGVTQNAIWDLLKLVFGVGLAAAAS